MAAPKRLPGDWRPAYSLREAVIYNRTNGKSRPADVVVRWRIASEPTNQSLVGLFRSHFPRTLKGQEVFHESHAKALARSACIVAVGMVANLPAAAQQQQQRPNIVIIWGDTFVMYSTDNGPHMNSWPDAGMTPFRSEKNTNWEGAYRVPAMFRWPGKIKPGQVSNEMVAHYDMLPTILAIAGDTEVTSKLLLQC
jgi:Sulfatase